MADRSVVVRFRADVTDFQRGTDAMARSTAELEARLKRANDQLERQELLSRNAANSADQWRANQSQLNTELSGSSRRLNTLNGRLDTYNQHLVNARNNQVQLNNAFGNGAAPIGTWRRQVADGGRDIDRFSGRLGFMVDGILTLAPALIPIGAQLAPLTSGLALIGTSGALGIASLVTAFQGVGDAAKAVNEYAIEPTTANLEKAQEAMAKLGPDARAFVVEWQKFRPVLKDIRDAAAEGGLPGIARAMDELEEAAPRVERLFNKVAEASGNVLADSAEKLTGPRWREFWNYLEDEAPSVITRVSAAIGDFAHGLGEMLVSSDPGSQGFLRWLTEVADGFDRWASSTQGREDVQAFLEYARQNGARVAAFFSAVGDAIVGIVRASQPLGGVVLDGLTAIARAIATIADSDMGAPIMAGVVALRLFNRMSAATAATQSRLAGINTFAYTGMASGNQYTTPLFGRLSATDRIRMGAAGRAERAAAQRSALMRGGTLLAAGGLLASGAADDLGLTNTAMLTLIGTMAGPWGAAAGAVVGGAMDAAAANNDFQASVEAVQGAVDQSDFTAMYDGLRAAREEAAAFQDKTDTGWFDFSASPGDALASLKNDVEGLFGKSDTEENAEAYAEMAEKVAMADESVAKLGRSLGMTVGPTDQSARSIAELESVVERARPAMDALGTSQEHLTELYRRQQVARGKDGTALEQAALKITNPGAWNAYEREIDRIRQKMLEMDSDAGRLDGVRTAIQGLGDDSLTSAEKMKNLTDAIDQLLAPGRDLESAIDAYREAVRALGDLHTEAGFIGAGPKAAENRSLTRDWQATLTTQLGAMTQDGAGPKELVRTILEARNDFTRKLTAEGFDFSEIQARLKAMDFDKIMRVTLREEGFDQATVAAFQLQDALAKMPKEKRTRFLAEGIPKNRADAIDLANKYKLTEGQRKALLTLVDRASPLLPSIEAALRDATRPRSARVSIDGPYGAQIAGIRAGLAAIQSKTVTVTVNQRTFRSGVQPGADGGTMTPHGIYLPGAGLQGFSLGGTVPGQRWPYGDKVAAPMLAPGEEVISNRWGQADRHRAWLRKVNASRAGTVPPPPDVMGVAGYADGGTVGAQGNGTLHATTLSGINLLAQSLASIGRDGPDGLPGGVKRLRAALKAMEKQVASTEKTLSREEAQRDRMVEMRDTVGQSLSAAELFGGGLAGFDLAVRANTNDTRRGARALARAERKGLDGDLYDALAASGDLAALQDFAGLTRGQIARRERQYARLQAAQTGFGSAAVVESFGISLKEQAGLIEDLRADLKGERKARRELERALEKAVERGSERGTRKGSRENRRGRDRDAGTRARAGR